MANGLSTMALFALASQVYEKRFCQPRRYSLWICVDNSLKLRKREYGNGSHLTINKSYPGQPTSLEATLEDNSKLDIAKPRIAPGFVVIVATNHLGIANVVSIQIKLLLKFFI